MVSVRTSEYLSKTSAYKLNPSNGKRITTIERSYIQTFPSDFKFSGTKTNLEQMIGNAVPVNLGTFIAKAIKEYCKSGAIKTSLFDESLPFELPNKALNRTG